MATFDPADRTVRELRTDVREIDDPDELRAIRDAEANGKNRKSATEAIERQLSRIDDATEGEDEAGSDEDDGEAGESSAGENDDGTESDSESESDETPGTSVGTAIASTGRRLDSIEQGAESASADGSAGAGEVDANATTLDEGDRRGIGSQGGLGAIEATETDDGSTETEAGDGSESGGSGGSDGDDGIGGSDRDDSETDGVNGGSTSDELRQRLSDFEAAAGSEGSEDDDATDEAEEDEDGKPRSERGNDDRTDDTESRDETAEGSDDEAADGEATDDAATNDATAGDDGDEETDSEDDSTETDEADGPTDTTETMSETQTRSETDGDDESSGEDDGTQTNEGTHAPDEDNASLIEVRSHVRDTAADLIGRPLDGISGIQRTDDEWSAIVDMLERQSVPDTQDILGRYEISLDANGNLKGYRRLNRYRRGDTVEEDWQ